MISEQATVVAYCSFSSDLSYSKGTDNFFNFRTQDSF